MTITGIERDDDTDYITLEPAVAHGKWMVVVMRWTHDGHVQARVSHEPLNRAAAEALAQSWSAAMKLEIRGL